MKRQRTRGEAPLDPEPSPGASTAKGGTPRGKGGQQDSLHPRHPPSGEPSISQEKASRSSACKKQCPWGAEGAVAHAPPCGSVPRGVGLQPHTAAVSAGHGGVLLAPHVGV